MRFVYGYKTRNNEERHGEISAASRDLAFRKLKAQGIHPFRVDLAPGFWNWILSMGKRVAIIGLLLIVVLVLIGVLVRERAEDKYSVGGFAKSIERRQIWGDAAIIRSAEASGWRGVFEREGERFLAKYARPGLKVPPVLFANRLEDLVADCLDEKIRVSENELIEYKQLKSIVSGMKDELREYVRDGGTIAGYIQCLQERQNEEVVIVRSVERKLCKLVGSESREKVIAEWNESNAKLRTMGLPTVMLPENF